nr:aminoglycoside 6'-N-acetyltransferase [uncultured Pseudoxanthomonas sp.]
MSARIRAATAADIDAWSAMRAELWPDADAGELRAEALAWDTGNGIALIAVGLGDRAIGLAEASLRRDYVNGTESSPVAFLEAWYVDPGHRGRGVGRALIAAAEDWTRAQGCSELASDALLDNTASHAAHAACGFEETERVVYFRKPLQG